MVKRDKDTKSMVYYRVDSGQNSWVLQDSSHHKIMETEQYFPNFLIFPLMSAPGVNFISKILGAEVGASLKRGLRLLQRKRIESY